MGALLRIAAVGATCIAAGGMAGCAGPGQYVWFDQLPPSAWSERQEYVIGAGDLITVRVLNHEEMSLHQKVRYDGRVAMPIIGEIEARGKRPGSLAAEIEARLKDYIVTPNVTVNVDDTQPMTVVLLGEVGKPGAYPLEPNSSLAHALAVGGGLTDYASTDSVYVVRQHPAPARIRFRYRDVYRNDGQAAAFPLQPGDIVEVE